MFAVAALLAAAVSVQALPVSLLRTVEASLVLPNTTQTNEVVYYYQNGNAGACGWYSEDEDVVVGLPTEFYSELDSVSPYCGTFVVVTDPRDNTTVTALVADASATNETLSLSMGTWAALNGSATDLTSVEWRFANETETDAAKAALNGTTVSTSSVAPSSTVAAVPSSSAAAVVVESTSTSEWVAPSSSSTHAEEKPSTTSQAPRTTTTTYHHTTTTTKAWVAPTTTTTTTTWSPKPTTTKAAATQYKQSSSSSSFSGTYSGQATYFYQNGNPGSCGVWNSDSTYLVAVNAAQMSGSLCGKMVQIKNTANGKTITAKVQDTCPGCGYGSLDLSTGAFGALGSYSSGVLPITWSYI
ncbi:hypothetical protein JCM10207_000942 [Rhodosporidiobolus poonsookiae]